MEELKIFGPVYFPWLLRGNVKRTADTSLKFIKFENIYFSINLFAFDNKNLRKYKAFVIRKFKYQD